MVESRGSEVTLVIAVVVISRGRPKGCRRVVDRVLDQDLRPGWELQLVVVDNNDEAGSIVSDDARVTVVHEPQPGIPDARNRGVATAVHSADIIAFIDDDEVPEDRKWLISLTRPIVEGRAEVTTGPVRSIFDDGISHWIRQQRVFQRPSYPDGSSRDVAYSGNVAVSVDLFLEQPVWFNPAFRYTGGEDTEFFRRVHRAGARILWLADAAVCEFVPDERARVRWILARSRRIGANRLQFVGAGGTPVGLRVLYFAGSLAEILLLLPAPLVMPFSRRYSLAALSRAHRGLGFLIALTGRRIKPYV